MSEHLLGQILSLLAALAWACGLIFFKRSGERVPPIALNLFKNTVAVLLLAITLLAMGDGPGRLGDFPSGDVYILLLSGVIGIALADTLFFHSLNLIGVGLNAIVDCLYSPFVVLFAWLLLSEGLSGSTLVGLGLILSAVLVSSRHAPPPDGESRRSLQSWSRA